MEQTTPQPNLLTEPAQKGTVVPEELPEPLLQLFKASRDKEEAGVKASLRPLSEGEAQVVEATEEVIPSRWLDVWKTKDDDEPNSYPPHYNIPSHLHAKSRWIIQGFKDPSILSLERSVCCDFAWPLLVADATGAFTQTDMSLKENQRTQKVYVKLPWQGLACFPGARIAELLCWIYGLSPSPLAWRSTILAFLKQQGFRIHPMSP
eukprot:641019-Amphidinium_carterae.1